MSSFGSLRNFLRKHYRRLAKYGLVTAVTFGAGLGLLYAGVNHLHLDPRLANYLLAAPGGALLTFLLHRFFTWRDRSTPVATFTSRAAVVRVMMWFPPNVTYLVAVSLGASYLSVKAGTSVIWGPVAFGIYYWFYDKKIATDSEKKKA